MAVDEVQSTSSVVSRSAVVNAPAAEVFALVADPRRHEELDGSGTVKNTVSGPDRLSQGAAFTVKMKQYGVPYRIKSKVTGFEEGRLVEWQHPAGHRWRWQLEPVSDGITTVTETWDASAALPPAKLLYAVSGQPGKNASGIEKTLAALQARYA